MKFPVFNVVKFVEQNGFLTSEMQYYFDQQSQSLQKGLSDNGWTIPQISATNLTAIQASQPDGTMWYVTTSNEVVIKINGALRKVTTTAYP